MDPFLRVDTLRCGALDVTRAPGVAKVINEWIKKPDPHGSTLLPNVGFLHYTADKHINYALSKARTHVGILYP